MTATMPPPLNEKAARLCGLPDSVLAEELYEAIRGLDDDVARDDLYWFATEVVERWAPAVEWALLVAYHAKETAPDKRAAELESSREGMANRAAARVLAFGEMGGRS
jgi:hypothetical protein